MNSSELSGQLGRAVRTARLERGLSLGDVAERAGLSKSILSRLERGSGNPSIETLWRIAQALDVPLGSLLESDSQPRVRRIASRTGQTLRGHSGLAAWLVHADARGHRTELFEIDLPANSTHDAAPHLPGTEEVVMCARGSAVVGPIAEEVSLKAGDAAWFEADGAHVYRAGARGAQLWNLLLVPIIAEHRADHRAAAAAR
ncbi:MAG: helix-turn-helix protein [Ilumatobacteraceae bacterium]|nr:helix-turn-helix protein [Ilumatobacteraceae bacterium]